ncbi:hypothetical protein ACPCG0_11205 [Propionibacteriaceae bacterium Y1923]
MSVTADGFQVRVGDVQVSGPAGVADIGDTVTVEEVTLPADLHGLDLSGSPVLNVTINDGAKQPAQPIRFQWDVPAGVDAETVAFITRPSDDAQWGGVPVEITGAQATAELDHLSWAWFVDAKKLAGEFLDNASKFLGQSTDAPQGCQQKVTQGQVTVSLASSTDLMHACVGIDGDQVTLKLAPNSPYMWLASATTARTTTFTPPSTLEGVVMGQLAVPLFLNGHQGILQPGGEATVVFPGPLEAGEQVVAFEISSALTQVPVLLTGVEMLVTMHGGLDIPEAELLEVGKCIIDAHQRVNATNPGEAANSGLGVFECWATIIGKNYGVQVPVLSVILAILRSLSGHLVTEIRGLVDTFPTNQLAHTVTVTVAEQDWRLTTSGFGPLQMRKPIPQNLRSQFTPAWECIGAARSPRSSCRHRSGSPRPTTPSAVAPDPTPARR